MHGRRYSHLFGGVPLKASDIDDSLSSIGDEQRYNVMDDLIKYLDEDHGNRGNPIPPINSGQIDLQSPLSKPNKQLFKSKHQRDLEIQPPFNVQLSPKV